ncbi:unnamed protein product [Schistosoma mattheei]|uniref:Uncharacterized protein n=1 Tax=Schistosoma mattheei TaxID=31246 RepID=A0A183PAX9_9TREM|nr:unnamed protein product [Schistosoma mattheei]
MLQYSGHEEVDLMLSKEAHNALIGWESHGSKIIKAHFKTSKEGIKINLIQCYALTNDSNDDNKDQFYDRLKSVIAKCARKDLTILIGRNGLREGNENCEEFTNVYAINKMVIGGTISSHRCVQEATWVSSD